MSMTDLMEKFPDAEIFELTELQYAEVGTGPWRLYIYDKHGYHSGGIWFTAGRIKYPDEEIDFAMAKEAADRAIGDGLEVRICDGADWLVFHSQDGETVYGSTFWNEANPDPKVTKIANRLLGKAK